MKKETYSFDAILYEESELTDSQRELVEAAKEATNHSYAPYSWLYVGAAVRLENGKIISGCNQENAVYPLGLCAERVAMFSAGAQYSEVPIVEIAIAARSINGFTEEPIPPCGGCRQVMQEKENRYDTPIKLYLVGKRGIRVIEKASSLLPLSFEDIKELI